MANDAMVNLRYMTNDVEESIAFYTTHLGFTLESNHAPAFGSVILGSLRLLLSGPQSSGARPMPDGSTPVPGGWNRVQVWVEDIGAEVEKLRAAGLHFRGDIVRGVGGSQAILDDPSGNPLELWQPSSRS